jgi:hypothetical protein
LAKTPDGMSFEDASVVRDRAIPALAYMRRAHVEQGPEHPDLPSGSIDTAAERPAVYLGTDVTAVRDDRRVDQCDRWARRMSPTTHGTISPTTVRRTT